MRFTALPPAPPTPTTMMIDPSVRGALISDINSSVITLFFRLKIMARRTMPN